MICSNKTRMSVALSLLWVSGCGASTHVGHRLSKLQARPDVAIAEKTAMEGLKTLRDHQAFPQMNIADVEVTTNGFTVSENPRSTGTYRTESVLSGHGLIVGNTTYVSGTNVQTTSVQLEERAPKHVFWFADVEKVLVYGSAEYLERDGASNEIKKSSDGLACSIIFDDRPPYTIVSADTKNFFRVVDSIARLSGKPLTYMPIAPRFGGYVDPRTKKLTIIVEDGPLDLAGIPLFARILRVDKRRVVKDGDLAWLQELEPGEHVVVFGAPGEMEPTSKKVNITH